MKKIIFGVILLLIIILEVLIVGSFPCFLLKVMALWCGILSRLVFNWLREAFSVYLSEALRPCFGLMLGMGTLSSYPFTHIIILYVILFLLVDGITWLIIRLLIS